MKKLFIFIGCAIIFFGAYSAMHPFFVSANTPEIEELNADIKAKRDKITQLEKSIAAYKEKIKGKQLEAASLGNQIALIDNRMSQVELDIEVTENKLDAINLEIVLLEEQIKAKEDQIDTQTVIIGELVRTMYYDQNKHIFEIIAAYDNFSDFYNQLQYIYTIEKDLGTSAKNLRLSRDELNGKHTQKEGMKLAFVEVQEDLAAKKEALSEQSFLKQNVLAQTHSSEMQYQTLLASLRSQYEQIEREITNIESQVRQRLQDEQRLEDLDRLIGQDPSKLSWPVPSRYITARFRDPDYPYRHVFEHNAVDIRAGQGTPLKAAAGGYVARAKQCSSASCYSFIMLIHPNGMSTVYGHVNRLVVSEDQYVARGDVIGYSGGTPGTIGAGPFVTGPHLHFEVRQNGIPVNPLNYLVRDWE